VSEHPVPALEARGLTRQFTAVTAVHDVDLVVRRGEAVGLVGPAGAGKSVLLRLCCGLLAPSEGTVRVHGHDLWRDARRARALLGYLPQDAIAHPHLSGRQFLRLAAGQAGLSRGRRQARIGELGGWLALEAADLEAPVGACDYGVRRRIELASLLLREPAVLLLDEPLLGLDAAGAGRVTALLRGLAGRGGAVVLSTRRPEVAGPACDRLALMERGRITGWRSGTGFAARSHDEHEDARREWAAGSRQS
jgi:ABC-2 type transport system ATP-binding protein